MRRLAGKYLKAKKLAKEMEEKAKKIDEVKNQAKESIKLAEEILEDSYDLGIEDEEAEGYIEEAEDLLDEKEFEDALDKSEEALDSLKETSKDIIDEIKDSIEEIKETFGGEGDIEESVEKIDESVEKIEENQFNEAFEIAAQARKSCNEIVQDKMEDNLRNIEYLLSSLEEWGQDTEDIEDTLVQARGAMDEGEFSEALSFYRTCKEDIDEKIEDYLDDIQNTVEDKEDVLRGNGVNMDEIDELLSKAQTRRNEADYEETVDLIEQAEQELEGAMGKVVERNIEKLEEEVEEALELGASVDEVKELIQRLDEIKGKKSPQQIYNVIDKAFEKVEEAKFERVLKTIAESRENFIKAKEMGIDISEPMNLLNKARDSLKDGDYQGALEWARSGREKVEELVGQHEKINKKLDEGKELIEKLSEAGIELPDAEEVLSESEEAVEEKNHEKAEEKLNELDEIVDEQASSEIMDIVEDFEVSVLSAQELGLDVDEYQEDLDSAASKSQSGEYVEAVKMASRGREELEDHIKEELEDRLENTRETISRIKEDMGEENLSENFDEVVEIVEKSEEEFEDEIYHESIKHLNEADERLEEWQVGKAKNSFEKAQETISLLEDLEIEDIDLDDLKDRLEDAEGSLDVNEYSKVVAISKEIQEQVQDELEDVADDEFSDAKREVVKAKKGGVDIEDMRNELIECKKKIRKEDYLDAITISVDVKERAQGALKARQEAKELITEVKNQIKEVTEESAIEDVSGAKELLQEAKELLKGGQYESSKERAQDAKAKLEELQKIQDIKDKKSELMTVIEKGEEIGVDISEYEEALERSPEDTYEEGYEASLQEIEDTKQRLKEKMVETVESRIEGTKDIIHSAKDIGISLEEPEEMVDEARALMNDDYYLEAIEKIEECRDRINEIRDKSKKAANKLKEIKEEIEEAKNINADVTKAEEMLDRAMENLRKDNYEIAMELAEDIEGRVEEAEVQRVEKIHSTFEDKIADVRSEGINTALADNLMRRAKKAKEEGNYKEAINLAMQSEGELERIELQQDIAERSINTTKNKLKEAREKGVKVKKAKEALEEAKEAYQGGFYVKAFDNAVESGEMLNKALKIHEEVNDFLEELDIIVQEGGKMDLEIGKIEDIKDSMEKRLEEGEYEDAYSLGGEAEEELEGLKSELKEKVEEFEEKLKDMEEEGKEVGEAIEKIRKARAKLEMDSMTEVFELVHQAREEIGEEEIEEYEEYLDETKELVKKASKFGAPVTETQDLIEEAEGLRDDDIKNAKEKAKEALREVERSLEPYSPKIEIVVEGHIIEEKWNDIELKIKNTGGGVAKDPELTIENAEVNGVELPEKLMADAEEEMKVEVRPDGDEVRFIGGGKRIFDDKEMKAELDVNVREGGFHLEEATGEEKCGICKGKIQEGLEMIVCECGGTYHRSCGERKGECPECGVEFEVKEKEKKASKRVALKI